MVKTISLCFEIHLKDYNRQTETNCAVNLQGWVYQGTFLQSSLFFKKKKIYLFLAALGPRCCTQAFSS